MIADKLYCVWKYTERANINRRLRPLSIKYTPMEPILGYEDKYLQNLIGTKFHKEIGGNHCLKQCPKFKGCYCFSITTFFPLDNATISI